MAIRRKYLKNRTKDAEQHRQPQGTAIGLADRSAKPPFGIRAPETAVENRNKHRIKKHIGDQYGSISDGTSQKTNDGNQQSKQED